MDKVTDKTIKYNVKMYGLLMIKYNEVIMKSLDTVKELLKDHYIVEVKTIKKQAVIIVKQEYIDEFGETCYIYNEFTYEILEKPTESEEFNLELDIKNELSKWISYRLMDVGVIYE